MDSQICSDCKVIKLAADFPRNRNRKCGLDTICRVCRTVRSHDHYTANRTKVIERSRQWQANNPERFKELQRKLKPKITNEEWVVRKAASKERQRQQYAALHPGLPSGRKMVNLTGQTFGLLLVLQYDRQNKWGDGKWICLCKCGQVTVTTGSNLRKGTSSCGCRGIVPGVCTKCGERKTPEEFPKDSRKGEGGRGTTCKACEVSRQRDWAKQTRTTRRKYARTRYRNNLEASREYAKLRKHRRRARLANVHADLTRQQWAAIKAAYRYRCTYCGKRKPLTQDHVIPISKGGNHTASNIVPACLSCNSSKGARLPLVTYQPHLIA